MDIQRLFYRVHLLDELDQPIAFLGNCFPVAPDGGMLTCRHVVERVQNGRIGVFDNEMGVYRALTQKPILHENPFSDLAFLPNALGRPKSQFFPILTPSALLVGESAYTYGHFSIGGFTDNIECGYFSGRIVNFYQIEHQQAAMMTLPYSIIEGLSGSPVLTYHNGPKLVGIVTGNRSSRILAAEILNYKDDRIEYRETINRIVEFGTAMHCVAIVHFLSVLPDVSIIVSDQSVSEVDLI